MIMSVIWTGMILLSILCACATGNIQSLSSAALSGAQSGVMLGLSMAGSLCLWAGVGALLNAGGITDLLSKAAMPLLQRVFPSAKGNRKLSAALCGNIAANFLGLGNAATPMGIEAAKELSHGSKVAGDELCRLIVLNTASIQLIPATVAAVRSSLGTASPFDILPAVWLTSLLSASSGVSMAFLLGRIRR